MQLKYLKIILRWVTEVEEKETLRKPEYLIKKLR